MLKNFFFLIFKSIRYRPIRSWLTVLGVVIAVMVVSLILSLGSGIQNVIGKQLQMFGSDLIFVMPGNENSFLSALIGGQKFRETDIQKLERIPGVDLATGMDVMTLNVEFRGEKQATYAYGVHLDEVRSIFENSQGVKVAYGEYPSGAADEVIIGKLVASELFDRRVRAGDEIIIKAKRFRVAGIFSSFGNPDDDSAIWVSMPVYKSLTGSQGVMTAMIRTASDFDINLVAEQVKFELGKQEVVQDFMVLTPQKIADVAGSILAAIELFLIFLALVSLLIGAVGIMNTMYTAILERTKQIGIMKAVGASGTGILLIFLIESGLIGLIGGVIGILLGILMAYLSSFGFAALGVEGMFSLASLDYLGFATVIIVTFLTGIISGVLPARAAARLEPAEALRYE